MANIKITELNGITKKASDDVLAIVDVSANETKKIAVEDLLDKNIELIAVTDTEPAECSYGEKYYNTTDKLIYIAIATDTWSEDGEEPISGILYIVYNEQASYSWNGTDLISVGGGKEDIVIDDEEPTDPDVKLWIDTGEIGSAVSEITNEYSTSTGLGYSANYINEAYGGEVVWENSDITQYVSSVQLSDTYRKIEVIYKYSVTLNTYVSSIIYNDNKKVQAIGITGDDNVLIQRNCSYNDPYVTFYNPLKYSTYGTADQSATGYMIPVKIIGYK